MGECAYGEPYGLLAAITTSDMVSGGVGGTGAGACAFWGAGIGLKIGRVAGKCGVMIGC